MKILRYCSAPVERLVPVNSTAVRGQGPCFLARTVVLIFLAGRLAAADDADRTVWQRETLAKLVTEMRRSDCAACHGHTASAGTVLGQLGRFSVSSDADVVASLAVRHESLREHVRRLYPEQAPQLLLHLGNRGQPHFFFGAAGSADQITADVKTFLAGVTEKGASPSDDLHHAMRDWIKAGAQLSPEVFRQVITEAAQLHGIRLPEAKEKRR